VLDTAEGQGSKHALGGLLGGMVWGDCGRVWVEAVQLQWFAGPK